MSDEPNWIFGKPIEADLMPRLVEEFSGFRPRWQKHLEFWSGEAAGSYIDMAEFVHFVVEELYPNGETERVQRAFDLMEEWLANGNEKARDLVVLGFLETLQNVASWQSFGRTAFVPFLRPKSRDAWNEIERVWAGKGSLADVLRAERKTER